MAVKNKQIISDKVIHRRWRVGLMNLQIYELMLWPQIMILSHLPLGGCLVGLIES